MMVVDTSALIAVALGEPQAAACLGILDREAELAMSASSAAECLIVARQRGIADEIDQLIARLGIEIVAVSAAEARRVAQAHATWGRGVHRAGLNFSDCFAYALAKERGCPLLFVGNDFARTDLTSALG
jgi:ribonuclease VapC